MAAESMRRLHSTSEDMYTKRWESGKVAQPEHQTSDLFSKLHWINSHTLRKDTVMEWFSNLYSTDISWVLNMCQATCLALFQQDLIQFSHSVDERSESERVKWLAQGYIASKGQSWDLEWSLQIPHLGMPCYFSLRNWNNFHILICDFYCLFIHPIAHSAVLEHKLAITNCWLDMAICLSTFWEARDHCKIRLLWRLL